VKSGSAVPVLGRRRGSPLPRQPRLPEIQVALDQAHRVLAHPALVAQALHEGAFDAGSLVDVLEAAVPRAG